MRVIRSKRIGLRFDEQIYQHRPLFITSDKFWDGGIRTDSALKDKAEFYSMAEKMSGIVKEIILSLNEEPIIGKPFCEYGEAYEQWSDLNSYELFREVSDRIKENKCYKLSLPEDNDIIDLIVESNFKYFTRLSLYLPVSNIIIRPSCHTEVLVYSQNNKEIMDTLQRAVEKHSDKEHKIRVAE